MLTTAQGAVRDRVYAALASGGEVFMSLQETFFGSRHAQVRDRFGVNWMIAREGTRS